MRLILDFVPNHVAPDHPWVSRASGVLRPRQRSDDRERSGILRSSLGIRRSFARGRDPYFPAWPDVLQLNAFNPGLRRAADRDAVDIATQCDGVRCDMAMLMMNPIFERTWAGREPGRPRTEYWADIIARRSSSHFPDFLFMAEAYWDREWELQQQGFDFCYDKRLYDRLEHDNAETVRLHLCADLPYQEKLVRFIENHDEPRAAATFSAGKERAAVMCRTLPGATAVPRGSVRRAHSQTARVPRQTPEEQPGRGSAGILRKAPAHIDCPPVFQDGQWSLCERTGWPDNPSFQNLVAWNWVKNEERYMVVVNLSDSAVQARVRVPWYDLAGESLQMVDVLSEAVYDRQADEIAGPGLYIELGPWMCHFFRCQRIGQSVMANAA